MGRAAAVSDGLSWPMVFLMVLFHVGAIAALFLFSWQRLVVMAVLYVLAINVGIGMCYHRLLTHRGYRVPKWIEYVMTVFATLSLEGGPIFWVSTHRVHHQLSDKEGDPHTPREGGWWAHAGWILFGQALHSQTKALSRYSPDLSRDRFHVWMSKYHWLPITLSAILLFTLGWYWGGFVNGLAMFLWGALLRVTLGLHATWLVNSATHMWAAAASRPTTIRATTGGSPCLPAARAGTTTITRTRSPRAMASSGTRSTPTSGASGSWPNSASPARFRLRNSIPRIPSPRGYSSSTILSS